MRATNGRRRWRGGGAIGTAAVTVGLVLGAAACGSSGSEGSAGSSTTVAGSTSVPDGPDAIRVAIVADSEVPDEVIDQLDARGDVTVVSRVAEPGWTIEQLDPGFDAALAAAPAGAGAPAGRTHRAPRGAGGPPGPPPARVDRAKAATCLVSVLPSSDTSSLPEPSRTQADDLLAGFGEVTDGWGVGVVSYPAIAATMADEGQRFYAEGELGGFHPGTQSYGRIVDALAPEGAACR